MDFYTMDNFYCVINAPTNNRNNLCDRMSTSPFIKFCLNKYNIRFNLFEIKTFILPVQIPMYTEQQNYKFVFLFKYKFINHCHLIYLLQPTHFLFFVRRSNPKHCKFKNQDGIKIHHRFIWFFLLIKPLVTS